MSIINKMEGSVILDFIIKTPSLPSDQFKAQIKNALLNDIPYHVLSIEDKSPLSSSKPLSAKPKNNQASQKKEKVPIEA